eukprot:1156326-Pelagomonas_calceolata.AAC.1
MRSSCTMCTPTLSPSSQLKSYWSLQWKHCSIQCSCHQQSMWQPKLHEAQNLDGKAHGEPTAQLLKHAGLAWPCLACLLNPGPAC